MKARLSISLIVAVTSSCIVYAGEMTPRPVVTSVRLYVLDCGTITNDRPEEFGVTRDEVKYTALADMCYLVLHPHGVLLWDTGLSDTLMGRPYFETAQSGLGIIKLNTLRGQLADIGLSPEMIDYLALSHGHFDHSGNANMFAGSTWLVSKQEREKMFPLTSDPAKDYSGYKNYDKLKTAKTVLIPADYDVFGDGTVIIKRAFGHSPGHSVLAVQLRETGPVLLAGDLYHYPEERVLHRIGASDAKTAAPHAREVIEAWADANHAQIWLAHDMSLFQRLRKAPDYYQ